MASPRELPTIGGNPGGAQDGRTRMWEEGARQRGKWMQGCSYLLSTYFVPAFFHLVSHIRTSTWFITPLCQWGNRRWERLHLSWPTIWGQVYLMPKPLVSLPQGTVSRWKVEFKLYPEGSEYSLAGISRRETWSQLHFRKKKKNYSEVMCRRGSRGSNNTEGAFPRKREKQFSHFCATKIRL